MLFYLTRITTPAFVRRILSALALARILLTGFTTPFTLSVHPAMLSRPSTFSNVTGISALPRNDGMLTMSNVPFAGAISNDFQFFTTYTPGPVVHTNGVAVIMWQKSINGGSDRVVPIRTGIYADGLRVAPSPALTNGPQPVIYFNLNMEGVDQ